MDWFIERLNQENPTLDYRDSVEHSDDFQKLLDLKLIKHTQTLESIMCDRCDEDHSTDPFRNAKGEIVISCAGSSRIVDPNELKIWGVNRDALIKNVRSRNPIIDKELFEQTTFTMKEACEGKKYAETSEPIRLAAIDVEIRGKDIYHRNKQTSVRITDTDRHLLYFLYFKYQSNSEECFTRDQLASVPFGENKKDDGYVKNRIAAINAAVKKAVGIPGKKSSLGPLIKYEQPRGYRLNPKVMEVGGG